MLSVMDNVYSFFFYIKEVQGVREINLGFLHQADLGVCTVGFFKIHFYFSIRVAQSQLCCFFYILGYRNIVQLDLRQFSMMVFCNYKFDVVLGGGEHHFN